MKIDVIIPFYNKSKCIERALASIDFDYVNHVYVIDDCSEEEIDLSNWDNLSYVRNDKNSGPSYSRNKGANLSDAEYLMFLDADDYYNKSVFPILSSIIKREEVNIVSWKIKQIKNDSAMQTINQNPKVFKQDCYFYHKEKSKGNLVMTASSFCIKRSVYMNSGGFDCSIRVQEDPEFFCRISSRNQTYYFDEILSYYDISDSNSLSQRYFDSVKLPLYVKQLRYDQSIYASRLYKSEFLRYYFLSLINKSNGNYKEFLQIDYLRKFGAVKKTIIQLSSFLPSIFYRELYKLFRFIKYVR
ncbi:glycosyltransferase family 2 protein [Vibrio japonicus]|uniref:Glycosyltransferase family 2 protein n=1 Tax=Vibrio japonicus TaxID=1824638 RepID=A0ABY5LL27_9VIBR|nr:glycosyltransferase family 2 protein [Vibrio japonicus]UUM30470.1 glycosyltransferase family 2 protein [Vibrio japonicus]